MSCGAIILANNGQASNDCILYGDYFARGYSKTRHSNLR